MYQDKAWNSLQQNSQPLELREALTLLETRLPVVRETESITITESMGRILAEDVVAPVNLPPFPCSAMDGYALSRSNWNSGQTRFKLAGESLAGHPDDSSLADGEARRVFTGAAIPRGADLVILQERVISKDDQEVEFEAHEPGESYIRPVAHDVAAGTTLSQQGDHIDAFSAGSLAAAGIAELRVFRKLRVGVFSTGDELVDPGVKLGHGQIYDSNRFTVLKLLSDDLLELHDLGRLPDDATITERALIQHAKEMDVLITSGGVSVGDADFITKTLQTQGELEFWRLNLKPGKPMAVARLESCVVFGLPGNPVSTIVTLLMIAKPAIQHLAGGKIPSADYFWAELQTPLAHTPGRTEFQRGNFESADGKLTVVSTGNQSSNRLRSFKDANCLIEIPAQSGDLIEGSRVRIVLLSQLAGVR